MYVYSSSFCFHACVLKKIGVIHLVIHNYVFVRSFNQLDLPAYETYDKLRSMLNKAVDECPEGFGLA